MSLLHLRRRAARAASQWAGRPARGGGRAAGEAPAGAATHRNVLPRPGSPTMMIISLFFWIPARRTTEFTPAMEELAHASEPVDS